MTTQTTSTRVEVMPPILITLEASENPYLNGPWEPTRDEVNAFDLEVLEGAIPAELDGVYLRNTQNQIHDPLGYFHPFDGDSMLHQIEFHDGRATYRNRWVRTRGFEAEQEAEGSLWAGFVDSPSLAYRNGYGFSGRMKDASSTDIVVHAGQALSLFYMNGEGYRVDALTLETLGIERWVPIDGISAHAKVNLATGELYFFNYTIFPPFAHYGVVDRDNNLTAYRPVPLPGPRLVHDMAFTQNYVIMPDFPMTMNSEGAIVMDWDATSRFAILPRDGREEPVRWFDALPTFVQHWTNAYEDGDEIVLDGYFQEDPLPTELPPGHPVDVAPSFAILHAGLVRPKLYRWRFNLVTGETSEGSIDDKRRTNLEFGMFNQHFAGLPYRYVYSVTLAADMFLMTGWVKHDLQTGESWELPLPENVFCSETPFAPSAGGRAEDDGFLVSFVTNQSDLTSECWILDARRIEDGPVARIAIPHRIKAGTHSTWASREELTTS